jgi:hypothetical protein
MKEELKHKTILNLETARACTELAFYIGVEAVVWGAGMIPAISRKAIRAITGSESDQPVRVEEDERGWFSDIYNDDIQN